MKPPRPEYPRPRLRRDRWENLNGTWSFAFDDADVGIAERWFTHSPGEATFAHRISVPFAFQSPCSGIGTTDRHDVVWYARAFTDPRGPDERLLLHLGAVDHEATLWVDGHQVGHHVGGHTPITADISGALGDGETHVVVVRAFDPLDDRTIPRGKQYWGSQPEGIFYTPTTGIWQTVWLEPVPAARLLDWEFHPDLASAEVEVVLHLAAAAVGATAHVRIRQDGRPVAQARRSVDRTRMALRLSVASGPDHQAGGADTRWGVATWSPEQPRLHDIEVVLERDGVVSDEVAGEFGMRSITIRDGQLQLNGAPYPLRLVLDQGYFPGGLLTAPSDEDLRRDIELAKELGFNGARKHQKVEDPRWLYWADHLGFLVWEEMPSAHASSAAATRRLVDEWQEVIARDRNHPCVITWVPINESWGLPDPPDDPRRASLLLTLVHLTRLLDPSRPVVSNDGWEHAGSDLLTVHDYGDAETVRDHFRDLATTLAAKPAGRELFADGHGYRGEPILVTEFGGLALGAQDGTWGYHTAMTPEAFVERYRSLLDALAASQVVQGFCYTQLTDVEQETNGLLTFDRHHKVEVAAIHAATTGWDQSSS